MRKSHKTKILLFRVDTGLLKRLTAAQVRMERSMSDTIRRLVVKALDAEEGGK